MLYEFLGSQTKERIFSHTLQRKDEAFTISDVARRTGVAVSYVKKTLDAMVQRGVLLKKNSMYTVNQDSFVVRSLEPLFSKEAFLEVLKIAVLRSLRKYKCMVALFGSAAKESEKPLSDVDVLVVCRDKDYLNIFGVTTALTERFRMSFGKEVEFTPIETSEFRKLKGRKDPFYINVLSEYVLWKDDLKVFS